MNNRNIAHYRKFLGKIIEKVLDILMPKEKRVRLLEKLGSDGLFENIPRAENLDFKTDKLKAIFSYKNPLCRQAIWEIKYRANKKLIRDFSLLLYEFILEELSDLETFDNFKNCILIPIPSSKEREREKGFNQCVLIARELIKIDKERTGNNFILLENFLIKKLDTPHQTKVSNRKKRLENLKGAFSVNESAWLGFQNNPLRLTKTNHSEGFLGAQPQDSQACGILSERLGTPLSVESIPQAWLSKHSFIIIDDVITTGATMNEAFLTLKSAGVSPAKIRGYALAH